MKALLVAAGLAVLAPAGAFAQFGEFIEGQCGGSYVGQDRGTYPCSEKRKPICQQSTGRCQCLERRACGGKQDEDW